jgi:UDP-N-acetylmuramoyl-tripeptide--D-alanyl-D-alanine ligase
LAILKSYQSKSELYDFISKSVVMFVNVDNKVQCRLSDGLNIFSYGSDAMADCRGEITEKYPSLAIAWYSGTKHGSTRTLLYGDYNFENVMAAISVGLYFGIDAENIDHAIASYRPENNRSQITTTDHNVLLLDAYNANPSSMAAALNNFRNYAANSKMVILGDMMELGNHSLEEHRKIVALVRELSFELMFAGEQFCKAAKMGRMCFASIQKAEKWFTDHLSAI